MTEMKVSLGERSYPIYIGSGALSLAGSLPMKNRRALIITDDGVPRQYSEAVKANIDAEVCEIYTVRTGEASKSLEALSDVIDEMCRLKMGRRDAVIAVGGGVVGDLTGFAASVYMRGIDFYNIPTTLLSMVDSSIGGKTAVNHSGIKNVVGAFYQPKAVIIDTDTLATLSERHRAAGLCEAIKMAVTSNADLFEYFERTEEKAVYGNIGWVIEEALKIKKDVVEADERESGLRRILNFGHTYGHGIESAAGGSLYHGECVAVGMLPMCSSSVRERLKKVLIKFGLPTEARVRIEDALEYASHDKKAVGASIDAVFVEKLGEAKVRSMSTEDIEKAVRDCFNANNNIHK